MGTLLKTRCQQGSLIIDEDRVTIELKLLGSFKSNSLSYKQITGVEVKTTIAAIPILSKGYATVKVYSVGDQKLEATMVVLKDARTAQELIESRIDK